ncbi:MAG: hypothetical protein ACRDJW_01345 [Thermomicrobiales bacterium]
MVSSPDSAAAPCVVDTMVLAMFVDADQVPLLSALAGGPIFVPPTIIDPEEIPPFGQQPTAEFAKGAFYLQQRLGRPLDAVRFQRRVAFYLDVNSRWRLVELSHAELRRTDELMDPTTWRQAGATDPSIRVKKIGRGEAECAAVAIARGWTLWSDDAAIVNLLAALHPGHPVERISDLLARAVREGLIACDTAADLYNTIFKETLGLWTRLALHCRDGQLVAQ